MTGRPDSLETLYARFDAIAKRRTSGNSSAAHRAIIERLDANRTYAEADGWTACELERQGGSGRLRLWGCPPAGVGREVVPDVPGTVETQPGPDGPQEASPEIDLGTRAAKSVRRAVGGTRLLGVDVVWGAERRQLDEERSRLDDETRR